MCLISGKPNYWPKLTRIKYILYTLCMTMFSLGRFNPYCTEKGRISVNSWYMLYAKSNYQGRLIIFVFYMTFMYDSHFKKSISCLCGRISSLSWQSCLIKFRQILKIAVLIFVKMNLADPFYHHKKIVLNVCIETDATIHWKKIFHTYLKNFW